MDNKVTFGLSNVHVAFINETSETQPAWETPIAIPGAVKLSFKAQGDSKPLYADNIEYFRVDSNNGYDGDIEFASIPDAILKDMLGWIIDSNGALVEDANGRPKRYALMGEVEGDKANRRFVYYNCQSSKADIENKSKEKSVDFDTQKIGISVAPIKIGDKNVIKLSLPCTAENKTAYDEFYKQVYQPVDKPAETKTIK